VGRGESTYTSGLVPGLDGLRLSGTTGNADYVTFGRPPALGAAKFTIETWFKRDGTGVTTSTGSGGLATALPLVTKGRAELEASNVDMNYFLGINVGTTSVLAADFEEGATGTTPGLNHPNRGRDADRAQHLVSRRGHLRRRQSPALSERRPGRPRARRRAAAAGRQHSACRARNGHDFHRGGRGLFRRDARRGAHLELRTQSATDRRGREP
jgi:hypothetical protein